LLRLALRNEDALDQVLFGGVLARCWYRLRHWLRPNTRKGSQRNIHAHYDIGNDFYRLGWTAAGLIRVPCSMATTA
jgi:cyclopropane-fatty-acyl-phospholipid synthase